MNGSFTLLIALLLASQSVACVADELVVYPPVPGLAASAHYKVRVRSASDGGEWQSAFAWEAVCKTNFMKELVQSPAGADITRVFFDDASKKRGLPPTPCLCR